MNKLAEIERYMKRKVLLNEDVNEAIDDLRAEGYSDEEIANQLSGSSGYSKDEIANALGASSSSRGEEPQKPESSQNTNVGGPTPRPDVSAADGGNNNPPNNPTAAGGGGNPPNGPTGGSGNDSVNIDFAQEWAAIKQSVDNIKNNFNAIKTDAANRGYIKNPSTLEKVQRVSGFIGGLGSAAAMAGSILSFIPGMQGVGAALRGVGMLAGGLGTAGNRGAAGVQSWKNGDKKGALANLGMAAMGLGTGIMGGKSLYNQFHTPTPAPQGRVDPAQNHNRGTVNQVPAERQGQIGTGAAAAAGAAGVAGAAAGNDGYQAAPTDLGTIRNEIYRYNNGTEADWVNNQDLIDKYGKDGVQQMRAIVNASAGGQAQMNDFQTYQNQSAIRDDNLARAGQATNMANDNIQQAIALRQSAQNHASDAMGIQNALERPDMNASYNHGLKRSLQRGLFDAMNQADLDRTNSGLRLDDANSFMQDATNYNTAANTAGAAANTAHQNWSNGLNWNL